MPSQDVTLYTIGHSNMSVEELVQLLRQQGVRVLVDVRSAPYAKYATQFNRDRLRADPALQAEGIRYMFAGQVLGGRPQGEPVAAQDREARYEEMARAESFQEALAKLVELARSTPTAIMCGEEAPHECHRRLLLGKALKAVGVGVRHIRKDGRVQTEEDLWQEETAGQLALGLD